MPDGARVLCCAIVPRYIRSYNLLGVIAECIASTYAATGANAVGHGGNARKVQVGAAPCDRARFRESRSSG
jgi:hypothetical protein